MASQFRSSSFCLHGPEISIVGMVTVRGQNIGSLFCDIKENENGHIIDHNKHWTSDSFSNLMQERFRTLGVGMDDSKMYTGHSLKRGCVQLYRSLNVRDEQIREIIQMRGAKAGLNYCIMYNDCAPPELPQFCSVNDFLKHASKISTEMGWDKDKTYLEEQLT